MASVLVSSWGVANHAPDHAFLEVVNTPDDPEGGVHSYADLHGDEADQVVGALPLAEHREDDAVAGLEGPTHYVPLEAAVEHCRDDLEVEVDVLLLAVLHEDSVEVSLGPEAVIHRVSLEVGEVCYHDLVLIVIHGLLHPVGDVKMSNPD